MTTPSLESSTMLAGVGATYGPPDNISMSKIPYPDVDDDAVLIRVGATTVNPADWHLMRGEPYIARLQVGLRSPKYPILGCEVAGTIEAVGGAVSQFSPGDEVIASTFMNGFGGFAELVAVGQNLVIPKPDSVGMAEAATLPLAGCTALQALRDHGKVEPEQRVMIIGASGGVGTFATQLAKHYGASVTAVCSGANRELVTSLGADRVVDYKTEDLAPAGHHDLVLHLAGDHSIKRCRSLLTDKGTMLTLSGDAPGRWLGPASRLIGAVLLNPFVSHKLGGFTVDPTAPDMATLADLVAEGTLTPVIDRTYPLNQLDRAITYLETGRARGKVVITP